MDSINNESYFKENYIGRGEILSFDFDASICDFIEKQIKKTPNNTALIFENTHITFQQLHDESNQLANFLLEAGIKPASVMALCLDPSAQMIIVILAILKTGSCYVPLDISYPEDRLNFMLKDCGANVLITTSKYISLLKNNGQIIISLDEIINNIKLQPSQFRSLAKATDLAYIIYTSGSTGVPKGVQISHRAINNHMLWMQKQFKFNKQHRILQKTPLSFDPSVWEIFIPLYSGASLIIAPEGSHVDPEALIDLIRRYKITTLQLVPSILKIFLMSDHLKACHTLRQVFVGGESLRSEIKNLFFEKFNCPLINLYGPTEVTIDSTFHIIRSSDKDLAVNNIGRPISNTNLYVIQKNNKLARIGEEGELYIGSLSLSNGYHQRNALTNENFIDNPFEPFQFKKIYKTGDMVRWLSNYDLEYLGRNNDQVKINGVRIEPNELVQTILKYKNVSDCIVIKKIDSHGHDYLACYLTAKKNTFLNLQSIKSQLKRKFPSYMLPRVWIPLQTIPLTVNGKINISALPEPDFDKPLLLPGNVSTATQNLILLWQMVLETNQIGLYDNFFEAGGGSLLALKLISLIKEQFRVTVKIRDIYEYPTIKDQILLIKKIKRLKENKISMSLPDPIICLSSKGSNTPIFLIHPIGGTIFWFSKLARLLNCNRPVYGVQDPSIDLEAIVLNSIEEMYVF
ncbi:MAG: amino acid adenylation domain-containing protein, partial [Silvanigrellaceae bacterium]|nr:amino acid adenylation domain-containing protein [Silvanigrellaceae bacterium]